MFRLLSILLLVTLPLAGCASTADPIVVDDDTTVVDVRTPQEFAAGHLTEAVNLDIGSASFDRDVAALDPARTYVVYCRSGNRSAAAAEIFADAGLDVTDAGGIDAASDATGLAVVTG